MKHSRSLDKHTIPWKLYILSMAESLFVFYIATFSLVLFFIHRGTHWILTGIMMALLYAFVIFMCIKRIFQKFSIAALMLIIPIAPLLALIIIISFIPILERFH